MATTLPTDGLDRPYLDPVTGDYVDESGRWKSDPTLGTLIAYLLRLERGSCVWAPELGSRLHTLRHATNDAAALARVYAFEALVPLRSAGRLPGLTIVPAFAGRELRLAISWVASSGRRVDPFVFVRRIG